MNISSLPRCIVIAAILILADKINGRRLANSVPQRDERNLKDLLINNQHWVELEKSPKRDDSEHYIVKRQSGQLTLATATDPSNADQLATTVIQKHNDLRSQEAIGEGAAFMYKMYGNSDLAAFAKNVTNTCYWDHSSNAQRSNKFGFNYFGENLAVTTAGWRTPESRIQSWFDEKNFYDYSSNTCQQGEMCGHYTQIVWGSSQYLGCAVTHCTPMVFPSGQTWSSAYFFACNYGEGGNYVGQRPYAKSTVCASCNSDCDNGLCDPNASGTTSTTTTTTMPPTTTTMPPTTTTMPPTTTSAATNNPATTTTTTTPSTTSNAAATTTPVTTNNPATTTTTPVTTNNPTTTSVPTTSQATTSACTQKDRNMYCSYYNFQLDICDGFSGYFDWANRNCNDTCNFCECRDFININTCVQYNSIYNVCQPNSNNYWFGKKFCKRTCGICSCKYKEVRL